LLVAVALALCAGGCVQTAECDATVPCPDGERCYDYECHTICADDTECGGGAVCLPCQQDDSEGTVDHCFEATDNVCVVEE
jgi:hypothetical protein